MVSVEPADMAVMRSPITHTPHRGGAGPQCFGTNSAGHHTRTEFVSMDVHRLAVSAAHRCAGLTRRRAVR